MSTELQNLIEAITILNATRIQAAGITFGWDKLYSAGLYLQEQVSEHFA